MYKIDKLKFSDFRSVIKSEYLDVEKRAIELNDFIFVEAICEIIDIDKFLVTSDLLKAEQIRMLLNKKINVLDFDKETILNISSYLIELFLYILSTHNILKAEIKKPLIKDTFENTALQKIEKLNLDFSYDIPYLAGYSSDGKTIYVDKDCVPKSSFDLQALSLHEYVEKSLFELFKYRENLYFKAHQIALRVEELFVVSMKSETYWNSYQYEIMSELIDKSANKKTFNLPERLDSTPYKDCGYEDLYFMEKDRTKIVLTLPIFIKNFENGYNRDRLEEIDEYCSFIGDKVKISSGNFLGFNDYISRSKSHIFGYISDESYYAKIINNFRFSIKETFVYYGYGIGFFEIVLNSLELIDLEKNRLSDFNDNLVYLKENNLNEKTFEFLFDLENKLKLNDSYLTTSFAISYFLISSNRESLQDIYEISKELCGENQSSKTESEFVKSGLENIYINHGFTGSVYFFDNYELEDDKISGIKAMNHFLYLVSNVIPELNFLTQNIIKLSVEVSKSDTYKVVENHLIVLKNIREKIDSFVFDIYPQNVNMFAIDSSIYDKAFEAWEFEKYILILKEQNKKIENLIQEFDTKLKHITDKKLNVFVKLLTGFSATSVFVDIFSHVNLNIGYYFLLIPIILIIFGMII